jgi:hypothetical protein
VRGGEIDLVELDLEHEETEEMEIDFSDANEPDEDALQLPSPQTMATLQNKIAAAPMSPAFAHASLDTKEGLSLNRDAKKSPLPVAMPVSTSKQLQSSQKQTEKDRKKLSKGVASAAEDMSGLLGASSNSCPSPKKRGVQDANHFELGDLSDEEEISSTRESTLHALDMYMR